MHIVLHTHLPAITEHLMMFCVRSAVTAFIHMITFQLRNDAVTWKLHYSPYVWMRKLAQRSEVTSTPSHSLVGAELRTELWFVHCQSSGLEPPRFPASYRTDEAQSR